MRTQSLFHIERREPATFTTFFPDILTKKREVWGQSSIATAGYWIKYRFVLGPLAAVRARLSAVAGDYNVYRKRKPIIDELGLYQELEEVTDTGIEYWDYAGRVDTLSRESVVVHYSDGSRNAFNRDYGVGFRGIIQRSESAWSMDAWVDRELKRMRMDSLNRGYPPIKKKITVQQPWKLRASMEDQLRDLMQVAWLEYATEATPARLEAVIQVEQAIHKYLLDTLDWVQSSGNWETSHMIPFPDANAAISLWNQDKIDELDYSETEPWWIDVPPEKTSQVTVVRAATLLNPKVKITLKMYPICSSLEHPQFNVAHHLLSYSECPNVGVALPNRNPNNRFRVPFVGSPKHKDPNERNKPWSGELETVPGWSVVKADGAMPEPQLDVYTRLVVISPDVASRMAAALTSDRPTLIFEHLNQASAPMLALPRQYFDTTIDPLFTGGNTATPLEAGNTVQGWATKKVYSPQVTYVSDLPRGFLSTPSEGRSLRAGAVSEILPY